MQLIVRIPGNSRNDFEDTAEITVNSEKDILSLGFAAARAVRAWVKSIPLVPSTGDLHFHITAEMVSGELAPPQAKSDTDAPKPKRKRKASK